MSGIFVREGVDYTLPEPSRPETGMVPPAAEAQEAEAETDGEAAQAPVEAPPAPDPQEEDLPDSTTCACYDGLYYVDYECNGYMDEWNFENWGVRYWSRSPDFEAYLEQSRLAP